MKFLLNRPLFHGSLRKQFLLVFIIIQLLFIIFLCLSNIMGIQYADQQVQQSSISMMKMFISQLDQQISEAENYLMTIYLNESCFVEIQSLQHIFS